MSAPLLHSPGIILRTLDYRDTDKIAVFCTPEHGKIVTLARHAQKSRRRFGSALTPLQQVTLWWHPRDEGMAFLEKIKVETPRLQLYDDWRRLSQAQLLLEWVDILCREGSHTAAYYPWLEKHIALFEAAEDVAPILLKAYWDLMELSGFLPSLRGCTHCHGHAKPAEAYFWSHAGGGYHCVRCRSFYGDSLSLQDVLRDHLLDWTEGHQAELAVASRIIRLWHDFLVYHVGRPLKSWDFLSRMDLI